MAAPTSLARRLLRLSNFTSLLGVRTHQVSPLASGQNNVRLYTNLRELKKFYKNATIATADGWYEINLDKRKLRTPCGNLFRVPNEALALAVATEWNGQEKLVKRHNMHLTNLSNTALDNPLRKTREDMASSIIHFLETDTICYRMEEPPELVHLQEEEWEPILEWARKRYGISVESTYDIAPPNITEGSKDIILKHLNAYSDWALFGYHYAVDAIKSLLLVMAVVDHHITVEKAIELATLEQRFQSKRWGNVEWYHDIDKYELQCRLAASVLFVHWVSENTTVRQKAALPMH